MQYETFDDMLEKGLTPAEYISELFERTDENGMLYLPARHTFMGTLEPEPTYDYCCRMDWNLARYEAVLKKFTAIHAAITKIAQMDNALWWSEEQAMAQLPDAEWYRIWFAYIREFETPQFCEEKIMDIDNRLQTLALAQAIAMKFADGKALEDCERGVLEEGLKLAVSEEEEDYYVRYHSMCQEQSELRIGKNVYAYETVVFAQRLYRLIQLGAPKVIIDNESINFAEAFVLHEYATEVKHASSVIRERKERMAQMSEEELDELDRERPQSNSAKSLLPLLVHEILVKHSSAKTPLQQQAIIDLLRQPPYEVNVERKAVGRTLHALNEMFPNSILCSKNGWWKE